MQTANRWPSSSWVAARPRNRPCDFLAHRFADDIIHGFVSRSDRVLPDTADSTVRSLLSLNLHHDQDVVTARQRAAQIARLLEFDTSEQTRLATAVSEIVRNAFRYAGHGSVHFEVDADARPQRLVVRVEDNGPGIAQPRRRAVRTLPVVDRNGDGHRRRTAVDGSVRRSTRTERAPAWLEKISPATRAAGDREAHRSDRRGRATAQPARTGRRNPARRTRSCCARSTNCSASSRNSPG